MMRSPRLLESGAGLGRRRGSGDVVAGHHQPAASGTAPPPPPGCARRQGDRTRECSAPHSTHCGRTGSTCRNDGSERRWARCSTTRRCAVWGLHAVGRRPAQRQRCIPRRLRNHRLLARAPFSAMAAVSGVQERPLGRRGGGGQVDGADLGRGGRRGGWGAGAVYVRSPALVMLSMLGVGAHQGDGGPRSAALAPPAMSRARLSGAAVALVSATPSMESITNAEAGRYTRLQLPHPPRRRRAARDPRHRPARHAARARALPVPPAHRRHRGDAGPRRAGDAVPQPPRLCTADAVPGLRPPHAMPQLHRLAGGASRPAPPHLPSLRPVEPVRPECVECGAEHPWCRSALASSASRRRWRSCSPRRAGW
jgi:hypothetical protein